jgi:hypothetical protein
MMSATILALRSLAPVIYGSTAVMVCILAVQMFGFDIIARVQEIGQKLMYRSRMSRTGA